MLCFRCYKDKPENEFNRDCTHKRGYKSSCRVCAKERRASYIFAEDGLKLCKKCRIRKTFEEFPINKQKAVGACKQCLVEYFLQCEKPTEKRCCRCKELKSCSEFAKDTKTKSGVMGRCKDCEKLNRIKFKDNIKNYYIKCQQDPIIKKERKINYRVWNANNTGIEITKEEYIKML